MAARGERPLVFLATLGPPAAYGPRATYAVNFFAAGGLTAFLDTNQRNVPVLAADFRASGARVACLCGSDILYQEQAVPTIEALRAAGATRILLAGKPGEREAILRSAGVAGFVYDGCDALGLLAEILREGKG